MAKIIYHKGTDTYFGLDDDVVVIDLDLIPEPIDAEVMDSEGHEIAVYWGKPLRLNDMDNGNTMSFSPTALREEAEYHLTSGAYTEDDEDWKVLQWACSASDDELNEVAGYILNGDDIWTMWKSEFWEGIREGFDVAKREGK